LAETIFKLAHVKTVGGLSGKLQIHQMSVALEHNWQQPKDKTIKKLLALCWLEKESSTLFSARNWVPNKPMKLSGSPSTGKYGMTDLSSLEKELDIKLIEEPKHHLGKELFRYWETLKEDPDAAPHTDQFDPIAIPKVLPYVSLLDVLDHGKNYKIRLMGTGATALVNEDRTGKRADEIAAGHDTQHKEYLRNYWLTLCNAAYTSTLPLHFHTTMNESERSFVTLEVSVLPMINDAKLIDRFLLGTFQVS
jgi:hypothetical protein